MKRCYIFQCSIFFYPLLQFLAIFWSSLPFARCLPFIRRPNSCLDVWPQLISALVLLQSLSVLFIGCLWQWNLCRYVLVSNIIAGYDLSSVSLLTTSAISVDRLLALLLGLRYRQVVTLKRTYVIVVMIWFTSTVASISYLLNRGITFWFSLILISLCLVTSIASYTKIFLKLRHPQIHVQGHAQLEQPGQINPLNIERYRKAVSSALWVQCTLVACYLPYGIVIALVSRSKASPYSDLFLDFASTLVNLNSSLNPFLYCWKISEVKQAVKETIRELSTLLFIELVQSLFRHNSKFNLMFSLFFKLYSV